MHVKSLLKLYCAIYCGGKKITILESNFLLFFFFIRISADLGYVEDIFAQK